MLSFGGMARLVARKLDPALLLSLNDRAAAHGVSLEEEHRRLLQSVLTPSESDERFNILKHVLVDELGTHDDAVFERSKDLPRNIAGFG